MSLRSINWFNKHWKLFCSVNRPLMLRVVLSMCFTNCGRGALSRRHFSLKSRVFCPRLQLGSQQVSVESLFRNLKRKKKGHKRFNFSFVLCAFSSQHPFLKQLKKCACWELHLFCLFLIWRPRGGLTLACTEGQLCFHRVLVGQAYEHILFRTMTENEMTQWKCCNEKSTKEVCGISFSLQHPRVSLAAQGYQEAWVGQFRAGAPWCTVSSNLLTKQTASFTTAPAMKWILILLC